MSNENRMGNAGNDHANRTEVFPSPLSPRTIFRPKSIHERGIRVDESEHLLHKLVAVLGIIQRRSAIRVRVHSFDNRSARCQLAHRPAAVGLRGIGHSSFAVWSVGIWIDNGLRLDLGLVTTGEHRCLSTSCGRFGSLDRYGYRVRLVYFENAQLRGRRRSTRPTSSSSHRSAR